MNIFVDPYIYLLAATRLGYTQTIYTNMQYQPVSDEYYRFFLMTYAEGAGVLRDIQCWLIRSEFEQAIGRARLDKNAAEEAFYGFTEKAVLNSQQISFVDRIIDYLNINDECRDCGLNNQDVLFILLLINTFNLIDIHLYNFHERNE